MVTTEARYVQDQLRTVTIVFTFDLPSPLELLLQLAPPPRHFNNLKPSPKHKSTTTNTSNRKNQHHSSPSLFTLVLNRSNPPIIDKAMVTPSTVSTSLPGIPPTCAVKLPITLANFAGLIALGPTRSERDILYNCCHTWQTQVFSVNETACLQTAVCEVHECSNKDPSFACVAMLRSEWQVDGLFVCLEGVEKSTGVRRKMTVKGMVLGIVMGLGGVFGAGWL